MEGKSNEFGVRGADYDQEGGGDETVSYEAQDEAIKRLSSSDLFSLITTADRLPEEGPHSGPGTEQRTRLLAMLLQRSHLLLDLTFRRWKHFLLHLRQASKSRRKT